MLFAVSFLTIYVAIVVLNPVLVVGHADAWNKGKVMHRDISDGNIVLWEKEAGGRLTGLLIDWDLCKLKSELEKENREIEKNRSVSLVL